MILTDPKFLSRLRYSLGISLIIGISVLVCLLLWWPSGFVKIGVAGAGELFEAYHGALNISRFGWRWAGLQDMATNPAIQSHPFLYIHHPNLGLYFSYMLRVLGVSSVEMQNLISGVGSLAGFGLAGFVVWRLTGSQMLAAIFLGIVALDVSYLANWSLNIHRAFSYFSVFGVVLAYIRVVDTQFKNLFWLISLFIACAVLVGADYMFYFHTFLAILLHATVFSSMNWSKSALAACVACVAFGSVFLIRQLQVILGAGFDTWATDFLYQVLNRVHKEHWFRGDWAKASTEFYADSFILNPGFAPHAGWGQRIYSFVVGTGEAFLRNVVGYLNPQPTYSLIAGLFTIGSLVVLLIVETIARTTKKAFWRVAARIISYAATALLVGAILSMAIVNAMTVHWWLAVACGVTGAIAACFIVIALVRVRSASVDHAQVTQLMSWSTAVLIACVIMYVLFPRYFLQWYPAFLLAPICVFLWTAGLISRSVLAIEGSKFQFSAVWSAALLKCVSLLPILLLPRQDDGDFARMLGEILGQPSASNFTPASVASYTQAFSGWLRPEAVEKLLITGRVEPSDYFMLFERDRSNPLYAQPRYFVFFKPLGPSGQTDSLTKRGIVPVAEGNTYILYKVR